jgi:imidazole glycerol-phosphate synthase subunit HisH
MSVCIVDADSGNKMSVYNLLKYLDFDVKISRSPQDLTDATHLILPGVGSYNNLMNNLKKYNLIDILSKEVLIKKKPFLGICVGMQVLSSFGYEFNKTSGLNWIEGVVRKINSSDLRLPHIGWNNLLFLKDHFIAKQIDQDLNFYFLHSFIFETKNIGSVIATTKYGESFTSIVNLNNIWGFQFHPEKSQVAGQLILRNFLNQ